MTNGNNTSVDTTNVTQTPLNVAATAATMTTVGANTSSTAAATTTTTTTLPVGNDADETTRRSLFGVGLYQTGREGGSPQACRRLPTGSGLGGGPGLLPNKVLFGPS
ncbi:hypothetical protein DY000_02029940 [Brassica cretica]|uniref:Uncharacterized protein n=1 Tax=Brassica cretica TaxID=69181 RepID=A0ABQ7DF23_BRACR|nr:hypothetical protein DY000_02029940 [Brassica cretica]